MPAFSGLFAPYWRSDARGAIVGLSRFNTKAHLARATLEAICYQTRDVADAMAQDSGVALEVLKVDGGATANDLCMQLQADILGVPVGRPVVAETTALGAAYAAGLAVGFWYGPDELRANWNEAERWQPRVDRDPREKGYAGWRKAVERTLDWVDVDSDRSVRTAGHCQRCRPTPVTYDGVGRRSSASEDDEVDAAMSTKQVQRLDRVVIRFAGDSGDGMQLTGDRFTSETAALGNDLSTLPNFPAEIRAPQGTLPGVSSFQLHFADHDVLTPGDAPDVLVAMNPAALKANLRDLPRGATLIVDTDEFTTRNLTKVGYAAEPARRRQPGLLPRAPARADLDHGRGAGGVRPDPQGQGAGEEHVRPRPAVLALPPPDEGTEKFLTASSPPSRRSSRPTSRRCTPAGTTARPPRTSRSPTRSPRRRRRPAPTATSPATSPWPTAWSRPRTGRPGRSCSAPTRSRPASDILHLLATLKRFGVTTIQAEDEIAGIGAALGASYGGAIGVTTTSGPGLALKAETIGLAVSPRAAAGRSATSSAAGPSTGLPTKTEQADLLQAMFGRNGESPVPIVAPSSPVDCFDGGDRGGPDRHDLPHAGHAALRRLPGQRLRAVAAPRRGRPARPAGGLRRPARTAKPPTAQPSSTPTTATPTTLARPWAPPGYAGPGAPDRRHREGRRHRRHLLRPRQPRPDGPAAPGQGRRHRRHHRRRSRSTTRAATPRCSSWAGARRTARSRPATRLVRDAGGRVARAHLRHLNPFPANTGEVLRRYRRVLVPEMNLGQLALLLRAKYLVDAVGYNRVRGLPFMATELADAITMQLEQLTAEPLTRRRRDEHRRSRPAGAHAVRACTASRGCRTTRRPRPSGSSPPTRRCAGARAAATTPSSPPCKGSCPCSG